MIARVATEISADRLFDYTVPDAFAPRLRPGQRVRVPFGHRVIDAYVVEIRDGEEGSGNREEGRGKREELGEAFFPGLEPVSTDASLSPVHASLKPLLAIEDDVPYLSPPLIALARWMADYACAPFELALRCALPAAVRNRDMKPKEQLYVEPVAGTFALTKRQTELLEGLRRVGGGWLHALTREFACTPQTLKALAEKGAAVIERRQMRRDPLANRKVLPSKPLPLMDEQAAALRVILAALESGAGEGARAPDLTFPGAIHSLPGSESYWHTRDYLPHFDRPGLVQFITFRLADSLPANVIETWRAELGLDTLSPTDHPGQEELVRRIAHYEDAGHGACPLRRPEAARVVIDVLQHDDGKAYRLLAWCVMPNHVHVLIEVLDGHELADIVQDWKSVSAHRLNHALRLHGKIWEPDYFDRYVRDSDHYRDVLKYIRSNPGIQSGARAPSPAGSGTVGAEIAGEGALAPDLNLHAATRTGECTRAPDSSPKPILLFGVTGSGKTEVYLQAIARALEQGKGAIVLVPEIALTPQTVQRFASRFGGRIAVLHSALSDGERFDEWHRIRTGEAVVVVGPRSAVFAPVRNLGLIVVDEEHEPSYKQDETPRYNARDVAVMRGHLEGCAVVLGSATPAMETWLNVQKGKYALTRLTRRVAGRPMPRVHVIDMRVETAKTGHAQIFSSVLLESLKLRLERGEQSILFLNRRGYANSLTCPKCGYTASCDACSVAFTYHQADTCLRCHICGCWRPVPEVCPDCGDPAFKYSGFGTQRVEQALQKCFPQARVLRMDADVTARKHSHDELLAIFKSGRADILIGTQMIAKGLDFPNVTLVGVLSADTSLHMPDFRAAERTYQLLAQVSGRAGRAELPGEVFVQTYSPEHFAVRAAASDEGFERFAEQELADRREGGYPPYARLVCLTFRGESEEKVRFTAERCARDLEAVAGAARMTVSEACPAPLARAKGLYRYQLLLRAATVRAMTRPLRGVLAKLPLPAGVSVAIDVDALNIL